jgi:hypothetical protein
VAHSVTTREADRSRRTDDPVASPAPSIRKDPVALTDVPDDEQRPRTAVWRDRPGCCSSRSRTLRRDDARDAGETRSRQVADTGDVPRWCLEALPGNMPCRVCVYRAQTEYERTNDRGCQDCCTAAHAAILSDGLSARQAGANQVPPDREMGRSVRHPVIAIARPRVRRHRAGKPASTASQHDRSTSGGNSQQDRPRHQAHLNVGFEAGGVAGARASVGGRVRMLMHAASERSGPPPASLLDRAGGLTQRIDAPESGDDRGKRSDVRQQVRTRA